MEPPASVEGVCTCTAAAEGELNELERLLAADPGLATSTDSRGRTPLMWAADYGKEGAVRMLLEAAPATALVPDSSGQLSLHEAAWGGSSEAVRLLLEAAPAAALIAGAEGYLPLHLAAADGSAEQVRLLLEAAPEAALTADVRGCLPLHFAAGAGSAEQVRLLLEAAPEAALTADAEGRLPLHFAADRGNTEAVPLLLEKAPEAAMVSTVERLPLEIVLDRARSSGVQNLPGYLEVARLLLSASPLERALPALEKAGEVAQPLFVDLAACKALSARQWWRLPYRCPALGAALPAVLVRCTVEAARLVAHLPDKVRQGLHTAALCLVRAQRVLGVELPAALVGQVLALAAGP